MNAAEPVNATSSAAPARTIPNAVPEWVRRRIETDVNTLYLKLRGWDVELESLEKTGIEELVSKYGTKSAADAPAIIEQTVVLEAQRGREAEADSQAEHSEAHSIEQGNNLSLETSEMEMEMESLVVTDHESSMAQLDDTSENV